MASDNSVGEYVILTPVCPGVVRVERNKASEAQEVLLVAGGQHRGIVIRKEASPGLDVPFDGCDVSLEFLVFITNKSTNEHSQERRLLKFWFFEKSKQTEQFHVAQEFFKQLLKPDEFPRDYAGFIKRLLKLMQGGFMPIQRLEVEMKKLEQPVKQPPSQHVYESNVWERAERGVSVDSSLVLEVLEHAYPAALSPEFISKSLKCSEDEVMIYLEELESQGLATRMPDTNHFARSAHILEQRVARDRELKIKGAAGPTVAIITALYAEKLAVDAMIEDRQTYVRYKTDGESNVYTLGTVAGRRVVATKLSAVGHTREAMTATGSITTRLLGGFQSIEHVLVVGVGGAVPHFTNPQRHVRLGDVVVSAPIDASNKPAYVYCDRLQRNRVTETLEGYAVKSWKQSDTGVVDAARQLSAAAEITPLCPPWYEWMQGASSALSQTGVNFERPDPETDKLYMWVGGTDVVEVSHPAHREYPRLHVGPIGSGRHVLKEPALRSDFAAQFDLNAYVQEFDAVVESIFGNRIDSWALVRGIADYTDGTRNKEWQAYAALQAAAVAKALIANLPSADSNGN